MKKILAVVVVAVILGAGISVEVARAATPPYIIGTSPTPVIAGQAMTIQGIGLSSGDSIDFWQGSVDVATRSPDYVSHNVDGTDGLTTPSVTGTFYITVTSGYGIVSNYFPVVIAPVGTPTQTCQPAPCYQQPPTYYPPTYPYQPPYQAAVGITSVTPATTGSIATIYGYGLTTGAVVNVAGMSIGATSASGNTLTFVVPNLSPASYQLTVNVGGVVSNPAMFTVLTGGQYMPSGCSYSCPGQIQGEITVTNVMLDPTFGRVFIIGFGLQVVSSVTATFTAADGSSSALQGTIQFGAVAVYLPPGWIHQMYTIILTSGGLMSPPFVSVV